MPDELVGVLELGRGGVQLVEDAPEPEMVAWLRRFPHLDVRRGPGTSFHYLAFNLRDARLADRRVREAIGLALDRDAMIRFLLGGAARSASGLLAPEHWAFAPAKPLRHDPRRARRLLDRAGFRDPDGNGPLPRFRLVYKTAYYNPFPPQEVANHTDAWTAVEYQEAQALQSQINSGQATGVVDLSPAATIRRGVVFIKYYDGAFLNGTVRLDGVPWPGVHVTAQDEFGIPHDTAVTDAAGRYSILLPFGTIRVQASVGTMDNRTMVAPTNVGDFTVAVSDDASMRVNKDANGDGVPDWLLTHDFAVPSQTLDGKVYMDANRNARRDSGEPVLGGASLTLARTDGTLSRTTQANADGHVLMNGLYAGLYRGTVAWEGHTVSLSNLTISQRQGPWTSR